MKKRGEGPIHKTLVTDLRQEREANNQNGDPAGPRIQSYRFIGNGETPTMVRGDTERICKYFYVFVLGYFVADD